MAQFSIPLVCIACLLGSSNEQTCKFPFNDVLLINVNVYADTLFLLVVNILLFIFFFIFSPVTFGLQELRVVVVVAVVVGVLVGGQFLKYVPIAVGQLPDPTHICRLTPPTMACRQNIVAAILVFWRA